MRICVFGLWHLGCVTAACLAKAGYDVVGLDPDEGVIRNLRNGRPPLFEPGLDALINGGVAAGRLRFESDAATAVARADLVWVTFDTPVDENDVPQIEAVTTPVLKLASLAPKDCLFLVSSQLPVGTTRRLGGATGRSIRFAYSPENLRLGKAIAVFSHPDRIVVGLQSEADRPKIEALFAPFESPVIWMSLESAEMTKHAINAFLATSVVFMNEVASLCEYAGADAKEVERGLKSEERIGPKAYLSPGGPFAGGTLARDISTLGDLARGFGIPADLITAVHTSNERHRSWALRKLGEQLGNLAKRRVALLGLTYKPGTSTLRRSSAVELAQALHGKGAVVTAFDPAVHALPSALAGVLTLTDSAEHALQGTDAVVLATPCPEFRALDWRALTATMRNPVVIDANGFLAASLSDQPGVRYTAVGRPLAMGQGAAHD